MSDPYPTQYQDTAYDAASLILREISNYLPNGGAPDVDLDTSQEMMRRRCRDIERNNDIGGAIIDRIVDHAIGCGLTLQIKISRDGDEDSDEIARLERVLEEKFAAWAEDCDFNGLSSFGEIQAMALASVLTSGDVLWNSIFLNDGDVLKFYVQTIEADQVSNPNLSMDTDRYRLGVELDEYGRPVAYHVLTRHPGDYIPSMHWNRLAIRGEVSGLRRAGLIARALRPNQHRGVPIFSRVLKKIRTLDRYTNAELIASVISSYLTIFVKKNNGGGFQEDEKQTDKRNIPLGPGMIVTLDPNEDITPVNPQRPNTAYAAFIIATLQQIGAGIGLPSSYILSVFNSSYSAARAEMLQAWKKILIYRGMMIRQFCLPIFKLWLDFEEVPMSIQSRIRTKWVGPARGAIDEYKEVQAAKERISAGLSTRQIEAEELGHDWLDLLTQLAIEENKIKEFGLNKDQNAVDEKLLKDEQDNEYSQDKDQNI